MSQRYIKNQNVNEVKEKSTLMPPPRHLPMLPDDRICEGWPTSTTNMAQDL
jgi:hypothetical protein